MPNFVSFAASIAELDNRVLSRSLSQSITHPAYLMPREPKRLRFGIYRRNFARELTSGCIMFGKFVGRAANGRV